MGRIECETAAQCQQIAQEMQSVVEPAVTAMVIGTVAVAVGFTAYREVRRDD